MKHVKIGKSNVEVSVIGLGTNAVGGHNLYPNLDENEGKELVRTAINEGIIFLDTAFAYGRGRSEELIGEVIKDYPREKIILATKASHRIDGKGHDNSPAFIKEAVHHALKRLQTDYIDIFYIHYPDNLTPELEAIEALQELKNQGIIKAIGVSNFSLKQLKRANKNGQIDVVQDEYNLINRHNEKTLMAYCQQENISFIPFFPLASGLLTGKYQKNVIFPKDDLRSNQENFQGDRYQKIITDVNRIQPLATKYQATITDIVLAWYLMRKDISAIIPGAKNSQQVLANVQGVKISLTENEFEMIDRWFSDY